MDENMNIDAMTNLHEISELVNENFVHGMTRDLVNLICRHQYRIGRDAALKLAKSVVENKELGDETAGTLGELIRHGREDGFFEKQTIDKSGHCNVCDGAPNADKRPTDQVVKGYKELVRLRDSTSRQSDYDLLRSWASQIVDELECRGYDTSQLPD